MWFSRFPVLPGSAEALVSWGGIVKRLLIAYFIGNISAKNYPNPFMCVSKLQQAKGWTFFWDTVYKHYIGYIGCERLLIFYIFVIYYA